MFKDKFSSDASEKINPPIKNPQQIEETPIHTMAQDLQDPDGSIARLNASQENLMNNFSKQNLNERQKSSPFLSPVGTQEFSPVQKQPVPQPPMAENSSKGTIIAVIIALLIILISGAGTYYFMITRQIDDDPEEQTLRIDNESELENKETAIKDELSMDKPNYLTLDTENTTPTSFKAILNEKAQAVIKSGTTAPIEFLAADNQNNPITFTDFAKMTGISLSPNIFVNLDQKFRLFIINDSSNPGIALAIDALNTDNLRNELPKEESLLSGQLGAILLPEHEPSTNPFADHTYKGQAIRYQNLISPQKLAIDYAITETQLLLATTKVTIESVIDKVSSKNQQSSEIIFADKLISCTKFKTTFKHPLTDDILEKEVLGVVDGKCVYIEQVPGGGKMECKFSESERVAVAQYYKALADAESFSSTYKGNAEKNTSTTTIDSKAIDNPLTKFMNSGVCSVSGY